MICGQMSMPTRRSLAAMYWVMCSLAGGCHAAIPAQGGRDGCSADDAKSSVLRAVRQFADAFRAGDVATIDSLLHERYVHTNNGNKPTSRAAWMSWFTARSQKMQRGELALLKYELASVEVELFSGVAVVTGRVDATTQAGGATEPSSIRFTNVWICSAGQWKRIAFHDSPASDAQ